MKNSTISTKKNQKLAAKNFVEFWENKGYEKGQSQSFWLSLLHDILEVEHPEHYITFEDKVKLDNTSFIDGYIEQTHVLIEQKSITKNLLNPIKQSDGSLLSPFQQAKRYSAELPYSKRPRWIVTCNFKEFHIYDMEQPSGEPEIIFLKDLPNEYYRLQFLINKNNDHIKKEVEISLQAGELVKELYNELLAQYIDPKNENSLKSLNMLCVRLVFCLYAEDAGLFGCHSKFHDYLEPINPKNIRTSLIELFKILNTKPDERDPYLEPILSSFPYVNGGLFSEDNIEIPNFNDHLKSLLLKNASAEFDWSNISPTIFGAVFESTLNPETRHSGGMHYTSIENIHKIIDPLFLNDLKFEFNNIKSIAIEKTRTKKLIEFQNKLSSLYFLDPACGSGNFLTQTYISLRELENELLICLSGGQFMLDTGGIIKVDIKQFYGIEINDFAAIVAKTALWIAESQMMKKTEEILFTNLDFLPLKSYAHIIEGNALELDWEDIIPKNKLNFIMGNPPFLGARLMNKSQKIDMDLVFNKMKGLKNLDYVSAWYKKSVLYTKDTSIVSAFVSTNSITQGDQPTILWKPILELGVNIDFAYRTFKWNSETKDKAAVHCVIIGFSYNNKKEKTLYSNEFINNKVENINPYLIAAPNIFIENRKTNISNAPKLDFGNMPNDGGFLSNYSTDDKDKLIHDFPIAKKMFKQFLGATEFINNKKRWCLWLTNILPNEIKSVPPIINAIKNVQEIRSQSSREATKKLANIPYLFGEIRQPNNDYLIIPRHSSETRKYIPIGYMNKDVICGDANLILENANLYLFGVLTSNVHMAWVKSICGRIKSDYRYSINIVYNNFPWCTPSKEQKYKIEKTAQAILDARNLYPENSLADLYNEMLMPLELRRAHQQNDKAVMEAYNFPIKSNFTESMCVSKLIDLYISTTKQQ